MLVLPVTVVVLAVSLVGIPLAVALLLLLALGLVFGPVPAVAALGNRMLRGRGGLYGAFLVGGIAWRLGIWLVPLVGLALYLGGLVLGVGGWLIGAWEQRRIPTRLAVATREAGADGADWEAPLPPSGATSGEEVAAPGDDAAGSGTRDG